MQLSIATLPTAEELLGGHGLRALLAQKWFSLHSTHLLSYQKKPGTHVHPARAAVPAGDVLLPGHASFASAPGQYASAAQASQAPGAAFSKPASHEQLASAVAPGAEDMCSGHEVQASMLRALLYLPAAHATQKVSFAPPGAYPASHRQAAKVDPGPSVPLSAGQDAHAGSPVCTVYVFRGHAAHASSPSALAT